MEFLTTLISAEVLKQLGFSGVFIIIITVLMFYVKKKDDMIQKLMEVINEQSLAIRENTNLNKEILEEQKKILEHSYIAKALLESINKS